MQRLVFVLLVLLLAPAVGFAQSGTWTQLGETFVEEGVGDYLGTAVAISSDGNRVVLGGKYNDGGGSNAGHVRVFQYSGTNWSQLGEDLDGEAGADQFGYAVDLSSAGDRVAVGAPGDAYGPATGQARIYEWNGSGWVKLGSDIQRDADDHSGYAIALSSDGTRVAIGAPSVHVHDWNGSAWVQVGSDIAPEAVGDYNFWSGYGKGLDLSADGNRLAIGASGSDGNGPDAGHVRVYEWNGTTWQQVGADVDGATGTTRFGTSVSLSSDGSTFASGSRWGSNEGHVRVFSWDGSNWSQVGTAVDGTAFVHGISLSADGTKFAAAAGLYGKGRAYNFIAGSWTQIGDGFIDLLESCLCSHPSLALSSDGNRVILSRSVFNYTPTPGVPTLPQWGMILLTLSLLAIATWQLAGLPAVATGVSGTVMGSGGSWLTSMLVGQVAATVGLGFYTVLVGPLVAHDGIGAFLAGVLLAVIIEGYRRAH